MRLPRISRRWRVRLAMAATGVGLFGGALFLASSAAGVLANKPAAPVDADLADQVRDAARFALRRQGVDAYTGRRLQQESPVRWQVSLISYAEDGTPRCWKQAVAFDANAAAPVGQPASVGCWPIPDVPSGPADGDIPNRDADLAARGFLDALLTGGEWQRWATPGALFPQPQPVASSDYALLDSHQSGDQVTVNGWIAAPTAADSSNRVDASWRVTLIPGPSGPVVDRLSAGPPPSSTGEAPGPTVPPTTSTTSPTTTTSNGSTSTTRKGQPE